MKRYAMRWRVVIQEGQRLKPGYGVAYHDYVRDVAVCYPVPWHLVVRTWLWLTYFWYRHVVSAKWYGTPFKTMYQQGHRDGTLQELTRRNREEMAMFHPDLHVLIKTLDQLYRSRLDQPMKEDLREEKDDE